MSQETNRAHDALRELHQQGSTVLPELEGKPRRSCQKDDVAKHLGVGCRRCFHRNGENAGQLRQVRRKKCQRATQAWPGLLTAESSASDICPVADATAAAAATAADPT